MPVSPDVRIRSFQQGDLLTLKRLYENEPVRFLRPREDWERFLRNGKSTQHGSEVWLILRGESVVAYAALNPRGSEMVELEEFAGDRAALVASLRLLMNEAHIPGVQLHTPSWDTALVALLSGASARPTHSSGTQLVVNFTQFMERLRPHMRERAGTAQERRLSFREYEGRFVVGVDGETVVSTTRGGAAQFIWGSREALEWEWSGGMEARSILEAIFPIPALNYGFSYV